MKIIEDVTNGNHGVDSRIHEISKAWPAVACEYEICFDFICLYVQIKYLNFIIDRSLFG